MSMLDSFFNKGFRAAKCKTLLKLTIPRIKLLRNRREIQIKQMRRDIAKLLETGQEATARIRVEHIIREENMMAAQEILELFCELIAVRLPIIETQRECPLDLKEAISSVCFAAPRCADLPELLQVQMLFASKYGKEFVAAAAELMPECGVNRQLIELLSVRAPSPDKKMKLLKEIAEEHELEWDPAASETELLKPHEDLLDGPTQFVSGSKLPLPKGKHEETLDTSPGRGPNEQSDTDSASDLLDLPEVPKVSLQPIGHSASAPEMLPMATALQPDLNHESSDQSPTFEGTGQEHHIEHKGVVDEKSETNKDEVPASELVSNEVKQFVPFISPPSVSASSVSARPSGSPPSISRMKSEANADLQDVLTAAQAAAETAERAAAAARSAATLAQARISELTKKNSEKFPDISGDENPFHVETSAEMPHFKHKYSFGDPDAASSFPYSHSYPEERKVSELPDLPSLDKLEIKYDSPSNDHSTEQEYSLHQPQRLPSMDDESYFSYPNLFTSQNSGRGSNAQSVNDNFRSSH